MRGQQSRWSSVICLRHFFSGSEDTDFALKANDYINPCLPVTNL